MKPTLPNPPDLEDLLAFWASIAILLGLAAGTGAWFVGVASGPGAIVLGTVAILALIRLALTSERRMNRSYERWDLAARRYARRARTVASAIWYWTVITAVARTGGSGLSRRGSSWLTRGSIANAAYGDPSGGTVDRVAHGSLREFARWAVRSGRTWAVVLLPLLGLLKAFEIQGRSADAPNIYTLY
jgi:hypothetical protein